MAHAIPVSRQCICLLDESVNRALPLWHPHCKYARRTYFTIFLQSIRQLKQTPSLPLFTERRNVNCHPLTLRRRRHQEQLPPQQRIVNSLGSYRILRAATRTNPLLSYFTIISTAPRPKACLSSNTCMPDLEKRLPLVRVHHRIDSPTTTTAGANEATICQYSALLIKYSCVHFRVR